MAKLGKKRLIYTVCRSLILANRHIKLGPGHSNTKDPLKIIYKCSGSFILSSYKSVAPHLTVIDKQDLGF